MTLVSAYVFLKEDCRLKVRLDPIELVLKATWTQKNVLELSNFLILSDLLPSLLDRGLFCWRLQSRIHRFSWPLLRGCRF